MLRLQRKLLVLVVVVFTAFNLLALEATHVLVHISFSLLFLISLCYGIHRLLNHFLHTPTTLTDTDPHNKGKPRSRTQNAEDITDSDEVDTQGKSKPSPLTLTLSLQNNLETSNYSRTVALVVLLLFASAIRAQVSAGIISFILAFFCFACVVLIYLETVPLAVTYLILLTGWWVACYQWLVYEICRAASYDRTSMCYIGWMYNPLLILALTIRPWILRYGPHWKQYLFKSITLFPYVFGFLFLTSWWCLVSVNTAWLHTATYTKADILRFLPSNHSLGATVIKTPADVINLIPESQYPVFFKPNQCTGEARGVSPIDTKEQALEYLRIRNDEKPERSTLMQTFHQGGGEATIIYYRYPYFSTGGIKTAWLKLNKLEFSQNAEMRRRVQEVFRGPDYFYFNRDRIPTEIRYDVAQSAKLIATLDYLANSVPGLSVARFDVKYESIEELRNGTFKVMEMDMPPFGDRSEKPRASDVTMETPNWILSLKQIRTVALWIYLGFSNIAMGYTTPVTTIMQIPKLINIAYSCEYHGSMSPVTPGIQ